MLSCGKQFQANMSYDLNAQHFLHVSVRLLVLI